MSEIEEETAVELEITELDKHVMAGCFAGFCFCPSPCTIDENIIRYRIEEPKV